MRNWPAPSVTATRTFSMSAGLEASTVTPGSTAPELSRTLPVRVACANPATGNRITNERSPRALARSRMKCLSLEAASRVVRRRSPPAAPPLHAERAKRHTTVGCEGTGSPAFDQPGGDRISGPDTRDFGRKIQGVVLSGHSHSSDLHAKTGRTRGRFFERSTIEQVLCWQRPGDHLGCMQVRTNAGAFIYGE